jgi:hypothetical protein
MVSAVRHAPSGTFDPDEYWIASRRPAPHPGARPLAGGWIPSVRRPLRANSHEMTELEFHISSPEKGWNGRDEIKEAICALLIVAEDAGSLRLPRRCRR